MTTSAIVKDGAADRVGKQAQRYPARGGRIRPVRAREAHSDPGYNGQLRPGQHGAQPIGGRLDPGRLEQEDSELVADQQDTHHERAHQHTVVEYDLKQGAIRRRIALRRSVCHMVSLLSLVLAARACLKSAWRLAHHPQRAVLNRSRCSDAVPVGQDVQSLSSSQAPWFQYPRPICCHITAAVLPLSKTRFDRCTIFLPQSLDLGYGAAVRAHCDEEASALCSIMIRVGSHDAFRVVWGHVRQVVSPPVVHYVKLYLRGGSVKCCL